MIRPNELRVWNLVKTKNGIEEIISIQSNGVFYSETCRDESGEFEPIPITEEWLERFGFEKEGKAVWMKSISDDGTTLQLWSGNNFISVCRSGLAAMHCHCQYVHQLQNLYFALTGNELELKTEKSLSIEEIMEAAQIDGKEIKTKNVMYHYWTKFKGDPTNEKYSSWHKKPIPGRWITIYDAIHLPFNYELTGIELARLERDLRENPDFEFKKIK